MERTKLNALMDLPFWAFDKASEALRKKLEWEMAAKLSAEGHSKLVANFANQSSNLNRLEGFDDLSNVCRARPDIQTTAQVVRENLERARSGSEGDIGIYLQEATLGVTYLAKVRRENPDLTPEDLKLISETEQAFIKEVKNYTDTPQIYSRKIYALDIKPKPLAPDIREALAKEFTK